MALIYAQAPSAVWHPLIPVFDALLASFEFTGSVALPSATSTPARSSPLTLFVYDGKQIQMDRVYLEPACTQSQENGTKCLWVELRLPKGMDQMEAAMFMIELENLHVIDQDDNRTVQQPGATVEITQDGSMVMKLVFYVKTKGTSFTLEMPDGQQIPIGPNG